MPLKQAPLSGALSLSYGPTIRWSPPCGGGGGGVRVCAARKMPKLSPLRCTRSAAGTVRQDEDIDRHINEPGADSSKNKS